MNPTFHELTVKEVRRETADAVSVSFEIPADLSKGYEFLPGQYLTLRTLVNGEDVRRSYSICSGRNDGELRVAIKEVPNGVFSTYANRTLRAGNQWAILQRLLTQQRINHLCFLQQVAGLLQYCP